MVNPSAAPLPPVPLYYSLLLSGILPPCISCLPSQLLRLLTPSYFSMLPSDRFVTGLWPANNPVTSGKGQQAAKMKTNRKAIKRWQRKQLEMQEMSRDDQHNTAKEGKVCDVVRSRLRNVLEGRGWGRGFGAPRGIKRNNYNSEPEGSWGFAIRQWTHVDECLLRSWGDYRAQETHAALWLFSSVMVTACAGLFSSLWEAAADISPAARLVNFVMRNERQSISSPVCRSHSEAEKETRRDGGGGWGSDRGIIRRGLTFDWTSQAIADSAVPSLIYWLFCLRLWQIRLCLRGLSSLRKCLNTLVFNLPQALFEDSV